MTTTSSSAAWPRGSSLRWACRWSARPGRTRRGRRPQRELRPDAALVDVGLPDGDGIALAAHLVALPWRPRVVVASSDPDATSTEAVQRFGAIGFMAKETLPDGQLATMLTGG